MRFGPNSYLMFSFFILLFSSCEDLDNKNKSNANANDGYSVNPNSIVTYSQTGDIQTTIKNIEYKRVIILATPYYNLFDAINAENNVVGLMNLSRVNNVAKHIQSVGEGAELDLEKILSLRPDLIICNTHQLDQVKSLNTPKLAYDLYLESLPSKRTKFLIMIGSVVNKVELATSTFLEIQNEFVYPKDPLGKTVLKLNNYGSGWFQPGCETYISNLIKAAGANPFCIEGSSKSEKVSNESAILSLSKNEILLFMDWGESKEGMEDRLKNILELDNHPSQLLYCNTTKSDYFQESVLNSYEIINDLHQVLKTGKKGAFFELISIEK